MTDTPITTPLARQGLAADQVPTALDAVGRPVESVVPVSWLAAQHWCESLWHRA